MLRSITVRNFRRLRDLVVDDLAQVNLLIGANNAGKTSLIEAIWLLRGLGDPQRLQRLPVFRGMDLAPEVTWPGLFGEGRLDETIEIVGREQDGYKGKLRISLVSGAGANGGASGDLTFPIPAQLIEAPLPQAIQLAYSVGRKGPVVRVWRAGTAPTGQDPGTLPEVRVIPTAFIPARRPLPPEQLASAVTIALDGPSAESILSALRELEPRLEKLSLGYLNHQPIVRAHVGTERPIPLQLLGEGAVRLLEFLVTIPLLQQGTLLIDEIENGLYYRNLPVMWRALSTATRESGVQLFATAHSIECIDAAVETFRDEPDRFRLHRLDTDDGLRAVTYNVADADIAAQMQLEVR